MSIRYVCALCESAVCVLSLQSSPWLFAWHEKNMLLPDMRPILYAHSMLIYCNIGRDPADIRSILYMYIYITSYACANASHDKCILYIHNIIVYFYGWSDALSFSALALFLALSLYLIPCPALSHVHTQQLAITANEYAYACTIHAFG